MKGLVAFAGLFGSYGGRCYTCIWGTCLWKRANDTFHTSMQCFGSTCFLSTWYDFAKSELWLLVIAWWSECSPTPSPFLSVPFWLCCRRRKIMWWRRFGKRREDKKSPNRDIVTHSGRSLGSQWNIVERVFRRSKLMQLESRSRIWFWACRHRYSTWLQDKFDFLEVQKHLHNEEHTFSSVVRHRFDLHYQWNIVCICFWE